MQQVSFVTIEQIARRHCGAHFPRGKSATALAIWLIGTVKFREVSMSGCLNFNAACEPACVSTTKRPVRR